MNDLPFILDDRLVVLHQRLRERYETVAVAESLTGGLVSAALSGTPGASATFRGGLVVYATDLKHSLAGVDADLLLERGAVDAEVARQLAHGVRERLRTTWGVGVTGVAGPDPQDGQPVGTVFIAVVDAGLEFGPETVEHLQLHGDRNTIRSETVTQVVRLLVDLIVDRPDATDGA